MAKQPATGQKKTKDAIAKAAAQKKGARKKWTKGKVKEKSNNAVFLDKAGYDRIVGELARMGKLISVSTVVDRFKVNGSVARRLIRELATGGQLKFLEAHSRQSLAVSAAPPKKADETKTAETKEVKKATKKAGKQ